MPIALTRLALVFVLLVSSSIALAQPYGEPDRASPGDAMIHAYLRQETDKIAAKYAEDVKTLDGWQAKRPQYVEEYFYMLGLSPRPEKTPLNATITGTIEGDGYIVDMLHYQSRPKLYVTGNLYRPAVVKKDEKLPGILYVCGHSGRGRNGNKVAYQSHGIWFARHGYVCLVVDTLQLGEIAAIHHGTYNLGRWWWHSRGYTPAGVEAWNGVRGIDYLSNRPDVDPSRIAVTGISGGGAATYWVTAADDRVQVAVPVSGMADLESYVGNRVINGHCDCMFLYNTFRWPWTRIAGLIAPRPMLFTNSDQDSIFPMDANERIINRLERLYSLYGAGDRVDSLVSVGGHAYRQDIRQGAFRFINSHLKGDARPVDDSESDIVSEGNRPGAYPIPPEKLRVFPNDGDLPSDQLNTKIDESFVPLANVPPPEAGKSEAWKKALVDELKRVSFGYFPAAIPAAKPHGPDGGQLASPIHDETLTSEDSIQFHLQYQSDWRAAGQEVVLVILNQDEVGTTPLWAKKLEKKGRAIVYCEPRGIGATKWTTKNPPNYVARSHALLGRTVDTGRVWDVIAAARYLAESGKKKSIHVAGSGAAGLIGAYAAILAPEIDEVTVVSPPTTHMDNAAPQFLNVLRVCDVPVSLGLLAPRTLHLVAVGHEFAGTVQDYAAANASERVTVAPVEAQ